MLRMGLRIITRGPFPGKETVLFDSNAHFDFRRGSAIPGALSKPAFIRCAHWCFRQPPCQTVALMNRWCESPINHRALLICYRLNSAIERGTTPDALGKKPCHRTSTLKAAIVHASRV